eukprot:ctg_226.g161
MAAAVSRRGTGRWRAPQRTTGSRRIPRQTRRVIDNFEGISDDRGTFGRYARSGDDEHAGRGGDGRQWGRREWRGGSHVQDRVPESEGEADQLSPQEEPDVCGHVGQEQLQRREAVPVAGTQADRRSQLGVRRGARARARRDPDRRRVQATDGGGVAAGASGAVARGRR